MTETLMSYSVGPSNVQHKELKTLEIMQACQNQGLEYMKTYSNAPVDRSSLVVVLEDNIDCGEQDPRVLLNLMITGHPNPIQFHDAEQKRQAFMQAVTQEYDRASVEAWSEISCREKNVPLHAKTIPPVSATRSAIFSSAIEESSYGDGASSFKAKIDLARYPGAAALRNFLLCSGKQRSSLDGSWLADMKVIQYRAYRSFVTGEQMGGRSVVKLENTSLPAAHLLASNLERVAYIRPIIIMFVPKEESGGSVLLSSYARQIQPLVLAPAADVAADRFQTLHQQPGYQHPTFLDRIANDVWKATRARQRGVRNAFQSLGANGSKQLYVVSLLDQTNESKGTLLQFEDVVDMHADVAGFRTSRQPVRGEILPVSNGVPGTFAIVSAAVETKARANGVQLYPAAVPRVTAINSTNAVTYDWAKNFVRRCPHGVGVLVESQRKPSRHRRPPVKVEYVHDNLSTLRPDRPPCSSSHEDTLIIQSGLCRGAQGCDRCEFPVEELPGSFHLDIDGRGNVPASNQSLIKTAAQRTCAQLQALQVHVRPDDLPQCTERDVITSRDCPPGPFALGSASVRMDEWLQSSNSYPGAKDHEALALLREEWVRNYRRTLWACAMEHVLLELFRSSEIRSFFRHWRSGADIVPLVAQLASSFVNTFQEHLKKLTAASATMSAESQEPVSTMERVSLMDWFTSVLNIALDPSDPRHGVLQKSSLKTFQTRLDAWRKVELDESSPIGLDLYTSLHVALRHEHEILGRFESEKLNAMVEGPRALSSFGVNPAIVIDLVHTYEFSFVPEILQSFFIDDHVHGVSVAHPLLSTDFIRENGDEGTIAMLHQALLDDLRCLQKSTSASTGELLPGEYATGALSQYLLNKTAYGQGRSIPGEEVKMDPKKSDVMPLEDSGLQGSGTSGRGMRTGFQERSAAEATGNAIITAVVSASTPCFMYVHTIPLSRGRCNIMIVPNDDKDEPPQCPRCDILRENVARDREKGLHNETFLEPWERVGSQLGEFVRVPITEAFKNLMLMAQFANPDVMSRMRFDVSAL